MTELADNGDALGHDTFGTLVEHTIVYRGGKVIDIGVPGSMTFPAGLGVNSHGQVVGSDRVINRPFMWDDGKLSYLEMGLPFGNTPMAVNNAGVVVGSGTTKQFNPHASRWVDGVFEDINPPWANDSIASAISDKGEIAGYGRNLQFRQRAILWREDGTAIDLGDFGGGFGQAYDVNDLSQVVGTATNSKHQIEAFLWKKGQLFLLSDLMPAGHGYNLSYAFSINDAGQILTTAGGTAGIQYLLLNPVPEPSTVVTIFLGGVVFITICRRRSRRK